LTHVLFERRSGIRTSDVVMLEDLGLAAKDRVHYVPSGWLALRRILRKREVSPNDVFIDFGSGMGRVVFQAAHYPFKRVIGVELSKELNDIAKENIERTIDRLTCKNIELINADVLDYEIPDDVTVVYFGNPFTGDIFASTVQKLKASLERNPRVLRIIYLNPIEEAILLREGARVERQVRGMRPSREWSRSNSIRMYTLSASSVLQLVSTMA
jgi:precorrin-6B methylase 2